MWAFPHIPAAHTSDSLMESPEGCNRYVPRQRGDNPMLIPRSLVLDSELCTGSNHSDGDGPTQARESSTRVDALVSSPQDHC